jgi:hypothetical protein
LIMFLVIRVAGYFALRYKLRHVRWVVVKKKNAISFLKAKIFYSKISHKKIEIQPNLTNSSALTTFSLPSRPVHQANFSFSSFQREA